MNVNIASFSDDSFFFQYEHVQSVVSAPREGELRISSVALESLVERRIAFDSTDSIQEKFDAWDAFSQVSRRVKNDIYNSFLPASNPNTYRRYETSPVYNDWNLISNTFMIYMSRSINRLRDTCLERSLLIGEEFQDPQLDPQLDPLLNFNKKMIEIFKEMGDVENQKQQDSIMIESKRKSSFQLALIIGRNQSISEDQHSDSELALSLESEYHGKFLSLRNSLEAALDILFNNGDISVGCADLYDSLKKRLYDLSNASLEPGVSYCPIRT